ncbi:MAG: leucine dehydrogenase [Woeseiaceae bacterium]|jgi:leucine dehydrogenase
MSSVYSHSSFDNHEQVIFVADKESGLRGIIGIHNTVLGPAAGGCRMYPYSSVDDALNDVLRLSRGMTMKNSAAGLPLGGGKCVIIADPSAGNKEQLLRAMARHVQRLAGSYWTAIDIGVNADDADIMAEECDYIFARASEFTGEGSAAHYTALGGFQGVRAVANYLRGHDDLSGLRVAVQGVGQTGADLISQLVEQGVDVVAADINEHALAAVSKKYAIRTVAPEVIHAQEVDVFAPCAMGAVLNDETIPQLNCAGIAGLANNQLERAEHGQQLLQRNIAYAPDFIVNAGGMIRAGMPIFSKPDKELALKNIGGLFDTIGGILRESRDHNLPTEEIAERIAVERINLATQT